MSWSKVKNKNTLLASLGSLRLILPAIKKLLQEQVKIFHKAKYTFFLLVYLKYTFLASIQKDSNNYNLLPR